METMEERVGQMQTSLRRWAAKLDQLIATANQVSAEARTDYRRRIDDLREKHRAAQATVDEIRASGSNNWKAFRAGVESAWDALDVAFKKLTN